MSERDHTPGDSSVATGDDHDDVPGGNLFDQPTLTALDPSDDGERESVERLLESTNDS